MRWKVPAGILLGLAFLVPAAPALAQTGSPGLNEDCQTVERKMYTDIRKLVPVDLDNASATDVRVAAARVLAAAMADSFEKLTGRIQELLNSTESDEDLRAFFKNEMQNDWTTELRARVNQTVAGAGDNVKAAGQKALDDGTIDALLAFLNKDVYVARELDCASPSPSVSASPSASPPVPASASASASAPAGAAGSLPTTGANTSFVALGGAALIVFGVGVVLVARRFRT